MRLELVRQGTHILLLTHVKPARQNEILTPMEGYKDYSVAFARSLILKTPPPLRATRKERGATALEQCVREVMVPPRALLTLRLRSGQAPQWHTGGRDARPTLNPEP